MPNVGEIFVCPHCHRESIVKMQRVMDGWTVVGERPICALCGTPLAGTPSTDEQSASKGSLKALANLLGESPPMEPVGLTGETGHFCKDCAHFLRHPFLSRCLFHNRPTEPMDDCADFAPLICEKPPGESDV